MKPWLIAALILVLLIVGFGTWAVRNGPLSFVSGYFLAPPAEPEGTVTLYEQEGGLKYFVYTPPEYSATGAPLPVIYHLHGAMPFPWTVTKRMVGADVTALANRIETLAQAGEMSPTVIVAPYDGFGFSMWSDSSSGHVSVEHQIINEIMPHIAASMNVLTTREDTTIQGFSMGGFGATKIGLKYPELFGRIVSWDGAIHSWETLNETRASIVENMFTSKQDFDLHSPWQAAAAIASTSDLAAPHIHLFSGTMAAPSRYTKDFQNHLSELGISFASSITDCPHDIFCFLSEERVRAVYAQT